VLITAISQLQRKQSYSKVACTLKEKHPDIFATEEDALVSLVRLMPALSSAAAEI
jgi:hypothetical protein